jgi:hypothetical protein
MAFNWYNAFRKNIVGAQNWPAMANPYTARTAELCKWNYMTKNEGMPHLPAYDHPGARPGGQPSGRDATPGHSVRASQRVAWFVLVRCFAGSDVPELPAGAAVPRVPGAASVSGDDSRCDRAHSAHNRREKVRRISPLYHGQYFHLGTVTGVLSAANDGAAFIGHSNAVAGRGNASTRSLTASGPGAGCIPPLLRMPLPEGYRAVPMRAFALSRITATSASPQCVAVEGIRLC